MGTYAKTAHKPGAIAPSAATEPGDAAQSPLQEFIEGYCQNPPIPDDALGDWYHAVTVKAHQAEADLAAAEAAGASGDDISTCRSAAAVA